MPKVLLFACIAIAIVLACGLLVVTPGTTHAAGSAPCDIYGAAGSPCVSADSTVRALYSAYNGPLYQVTRSSDNATQDIGLLSAGGIANAATQDTFCANTTCTITKIYDQSPQHNDLLVEAGKSAAIANQLPITIGGKKAYGVFINAGMGYRHPVGSGVAVNGQPEGMYMVASGTHVNNGCCFDYGNVEAQVRDTGASHMDAVNLSTTCFFSSPACNGNGPWVEADLENGLFMAGSGNNPNNTGNASTFVTALLKNDGQHNFALKGGNAQSGGLTTWYNGSLPNGYQPMHQEGSIVLGTGGDGSSGSIGSFFEGVMTAGFPTDTADNSVQANIVASGYAISSGPALTPGSAISLRATTACCTTRYIRHQGASVVTSVISSSSSSGDKGDATWIVRNGLANSSCVSFESQDAPGQFMRQQNFVMQLQTNDGSSQFAADATFCPQTGMNGQGNSFASYDYPSRFIRHYNAVVYIASDGGPNSFDSSNVWTDDVSWVVSPPWATGLTPGSAISLRATTACCTTRYIRHQGANVVTSVISSSSSSGDKGDSTWIVRNGLANGSCVSFESQDAPGQFMRQQNFVMQLQTNDNSSQFAADATFCPQAGMNGQGNSFASYDYPSRFIRHYNAIVYIASDGGPNSFDSSNYWTDDVSWVVSPPWV